MKGGGRMIDDIIGSANSEVLRASKDLEEARKKEDKYEIKKCEGILKKARKELERLQDVPKSLPDTHFYSQYD